MLPVIAGCVLGPVWLVLTTVELWGMGGLLAGLWIGLGAVLAFAWQTNRNSRLEIWPECVRYHGVFGRVQELRLEHIQGFQIRRGRHERHLVFVPRVKIHKPLSFALVLERESELLEWVTGQFCDLDAERFQSEMQTILSDERLGSSEAQRRAALHAAQRYSRILNVSAFAVAIWVLGYPQPYSVAMAVAMAMPVLNLLLLLKSRGLIRFASNHCSPYPHTLLALFLPSLALLTRGLSAGHFLDWEQFWVPFAVVGTALLGATLLCASDVRNRVGLMLGASCLCLVYSAGFVAHVNSFYDRTKPAVYRTVVQSRHISRGKSTSYHLTISPWLDLPMAYEVRVSRAFYEKHPEHSVAHILVYEGVFGIPWYQVQ